MRHAVFLVTALLIVVAPSLAAQSRWTLSREWTANADTDSSVPMHFGHNGPKLVFGPDGRIYAPDSRNYTVTVLSAKGKVVARIGRQGRGPGEFLSVESLGFRGDTLWVVD